MCSFDVFCSIFGWNLVGANMTPCVSLHWIQLAAFHPSKHGVGTSDQFATCTPVDPTAANLYSCGSYCSKLVLLLILLQQTFTPVDPTAANLYSCGSFCSKTVLKISFFSWSFQKKKRVLFVTADGLILDLGICRAVAWIGAVQTVEGWWLTGSGKLW